MRAWAYRCDVANYPQQKNNAGVGREVACNLSTDAPAFYGVNHCPTNSEAYHFK